MDITELLAFSEKQGASDLHLSAGLPPMIRVDGDIRRINLPALDHKEVHSLIYEIMNDKQRKDYEEFFECDFSFEVPGVARFRVNAFNQNRGAGGVFRLLQRVLQQLLEATAQLRRARVQREGGRAAVGVRLQCGPAALAHLLGQEALPGVRRRDCGDGTVILSRRPRRRMRRVSLDAETDRATPGSQHRPSSTTPPS